MKGSTGTLVGNGERKERGSKDQSGQWAFNLRWIFWQVPKVAQPNISDDREKIPAGAVSCLALWLVGYKATRLHATQIAWLVRSSQKISLVSGKDYGVRWE